MLARCARPLFVALLALACSRPSAAPDASPAPEPLRAPPIVPTTEIEAPAPDWLESVDEDAWSALAARSDEHAIARTEVVKVLWDHVTDRVYFCQSERWPLHYDFAVRFLQTDERTFGDRAAFNRAQYLRADRSLQMASLVRYRDLDLLAVELGPADTLAPDGVHALLDRLEPLVHLPETLRYRPRSEAQLRTAEPFAERLRLLAPNEPWARVDYQPVTLGTSVGRLRFVDGELDAATVLSDEILVLPHVPTDIPLAAGVITAEIQAPLAHVAVLTASRGTPNMALRSVLEDATLRTLDDRIVRIEVRSDGYTIVPATAEELATALAASRPPPLPPPTHDVAHDALVDAIDLRLGDAAWAGAKAAQLGEVSASGVPTSEGFVVPLAHYARHIERNAIETRADALRSTARFSEDGHVRDARLAALRDAITRSEIDTALVSAVRSRIRRIPGRRWIFRSSSNAEDLPGFSGAGLYDSVVTDRDPEERAIADAIRAVWASTYGRRAWDEREHYRVDHDQVGMAVLVQPFVDDVVATGVAITENPFSLRRSGILVDLAPAGSSVTGASGDELPEQILLLRHSSPEVISRSTRAGGVPILREAWLRPLRATLDRAHAHMMALWGERADAADIELAIRRDGTAVILQARPYRMRR